MKIDTGGSTGHAATIDRQGFTVLNIFYSVQEANFSQK
jgi:hypothetical protein